MLQRPSLEFMARNCLRLRWRARLERVPGAARLTLQVSENPIDMKLTLWVMIELKVSESTLSSQNPVTSAISSL